MDYKQMVDEAWEAVSDVDEEEAQRLAFGRVLDAMISRGPSPPGQELAAQTTPAEASGAAPQEEAIQECDNVTEVANQLGVTRDEVEAVFDLNPPPGTERDVELSISELPNTRGQAAPKQRQLGLLAGLEEALCGDLSFRFSKDRWADFCRRFDAYDENDRKNFSNNTKMTPPWFEESDEPGTWRLTAPGRRQLADLVRKIAEHGGG